MKYFVVVIVLAVLASVYCHPHLAVAPETLESADANLAVDADAHIIRKVRAFFGGGCGRCGGGFGGGYGGRPYGGGYGGRPYGGGYGGRPYGGGGGFGGGFASASAQASSSSYGGGFGFGK